MKENSVDLLRLRYFDEEGSLLDRSFGFYQDLPEVAKKTTPEELTELEKAVGKTEVKNYIILLGKLPKNIVNGLVSVRDSINSFGESSNQKLSLLEVRNLISGISYSTKEPVPTVTDNMKIYLKGVHNFNDFVRKHPEIFETYIGNMFHEFRFHSFLETLYSLKGNLGRIEDLEKQIEDISKGRMKVRIERAGFGCSGSFFVPVKHEESKPIQESVLNQFPHGPHVGFVDLGLAQVDEEPYLSLETIQTDMLNGKVRKSIPASLREHYLRGKSHWANFAVSVLEDTARNLGYTGTIIPTPETLAKKRHGGFEYRRNIFGQETPEKEKRKDYVYRLYTALPESRGYEIKNLTATYPLIMQPSDHSPNEIQGSYWVVGV